MKIIGCDFHPSFQQIAMCDTETGEFQERKLSHADGQAERFYRELVGPVLIGIEATGNSQWFLDLVGQLGYEIRVGMRLRSGPAMCASRVPTAGCASSVDPAVRETVSPVVDAKRGDAGSAAVAPPPGQAGRDPDQGKEQPSAPGDEPGDAEEESAVDAAWDEQFQQLAMPGWAGVRREDLSHLLKQLNGQIETLDRAMSRLPVSIPRPSC